jgi:hypothetical protein
MRFRALTAAGQQAALRADHRAVAHTLAGALKLWRGAPLDS